MGNTHGAKHSQHATRSKERKEWIFRTKRKAMEAYTHHWRRLLRGEKGTYTCKPSRKNKKHRSCITFLLEALHRTKARMGEPRTVRYTAKPRVQASHGAARDRKTHPPFVKCSLYVCEKAKHDTTITLKGSKKTAKELCFFVRSLSRERLHHFFCIAGSV